MAWWMRVLVGRRITRRPGRAQFCPRPEERYIGLLVHGDDLTVGVPTQEEKWFKSVLFSKHDGKCTEKFPSNGNGAMEASFLNRVIRWDPTSGRAGLEADTRHVAMVRRDLASEKSTLLMLVSGPSGLVICCRLSGTSDEESNDERPRRTQTCWAILVRTTSWSDHKILPVVLEVFCDAEHAGDAGTRKSLSGMAHLIKHGSAVQSTSVKQWRV